jgi:2-haloacid dehalogenase
MQYSKDMSKTSTVSASASANTVATGPSLPQAVLFDAYGTLFDVYSVAVLAERLFPGKGQLLTVLWRDKQIEYTRLVTTSNHGAHYQPFWELTRAALIFAIKKLVGCVDSTRASAEFDQQITQLMDQYRSLSAFPENRAVLQALKAQGIPTGILSNGDASMLDAALQSSGLHTLIDHVISVDPVRKFKTHPEAYAVGEQTLKLPAASVLFVSSNAWDALGATWFGYQTLWVNRYQQPWEEIGPAPTYAGTSLGDVLRVPGLAPTPRDAK